MRIVQQHIRPPDPTYYNRTMRGWSIPLGRWMGVEMRVHVFFPLLAIVCLGISAATAGGAAWALFLVLVAAVASAKPLA